jgi:hypothetical protein
MSGNWGIGEDGDLVLRIIGCFNHYAKCHWRLHMAIAGSLRQGAEDGGYITSRI